MEEPRYDKFRIYTIISWVAVAIVGVCGLIALISFFTSWKIGLFVLPLQLMAIGVQAYCNYKRKELAIEAASDKVIEENRLAREKEKKEKDDGVGLARRQFEDGRPSEYFINNEPIEKFFDDHFAAKSGKKVSVEKSIDEMNEEELNAKLEECIENENYELCDKIKNKLGGKV